MRRLAPHEIALIVLVVIMLTAIVGPLACSPPQAQRERPDSGAAGYFQVDEWVSRDKRVRCYHRHDYQNTDDIFCLRMEMGDR